MSIPQIPTNAPFTPEQISWLNGFLSGVFSGNESSIPAAAPAPAVPITIAYGSQTGTAESLAKKTTKELKKQGFAPALTELNDLTLDALSTLAHLLVITSTHGDGDAPDNADSFVESLHTSEAPSLKQLQYSVLALGDTGYEKFCETGKQIDSQLAKRGATAITPRVDCDGDPDDLYKKWLDTVKEKITNENMSTEPTITESTPAGTTVAFETPIEYSRKTPFTAIVAENYNLNGAGSAKETRHLTISLKDSGLEYQAGDALGVVPLNDPQLSLDTLLAAGIDPQTTISLEGTAEKNALLSIQEDYDISALSKKILTSYQKIVASDALQAILDDSQEVRNYIDGRNLIDLLQDFPPQFAKPEDFFQLLTPLKPRLYSISSSPKTRTDEVCITVGAVRYHTHGRERKGVCSVYLSEQALVDAPVKVYVHTNKIFKLPEDRSLPIIMVGPGTGIAPFRAFLEERAATKATGENWLFFGDQHQSTDFLYQKELLRMQESGILHRIDTAFSRDQKEKIYVQNRIEEKGAELFQWLEKGAYFYVCGDASRMAKDVDQALQALIQKHGNFDDAQTKDYFKKLKKEKRYLRDVY